MSCGCNNNYGGGWGGCGCANTVQYAPPACNPNFPTSCYPLGTGVIQRVVGEDSASCKYTVPTLSSNSVLFYNASTGIVNWADGSSANPIKLSSSIPVQSSGSILATSAASGNLGQIVELFPASTTEATFPIVPIGGSAVNWGPIENLIPSQGIVYKNSSNVVTQAPLGTSGQVLAINSSGVPAFTTLTTTNPAFIDARSVNISYASPSTLNVAFGNLVVQNQSGSYIAINNSSTYTLNTAVSGIANGLDVSGGLSASTYYYIFAIYNPTTSTVATLASASPTSPTLPAGAGYTYYRLIGLLRSNASSQIDTYYFQNGRAVNLGQTANVVVSTQSTQATNKYWSGSVSYAPYQYVDKAFFRFSLIGASTTQTANVIISNTTAGTTGGTQPALATTAEVYGAFIVAPAYGATTNAVYGSTTCVVPNNSNSYFNIYTTAVLGTGDSFALQISGYELSFL